MSHVVASRVSLYPFKVEDGRPWYLLLRRPEGAPRAPGAWEAVHSALDATEHASHSAVRALEEQTALEPVSLWAVDHVESRYDHETDEIVLAPCFAMLVTGELELSPLHDASRWLSHREARNAFRSDPSRQALELAHRDVGQVCARGALPDPALRVLLEPKWVP